MKTLTKTYNGKKYTVRELADGRWQMGARKYPSLTTIAMEILIAAGAKGRVSGPRWFGHDEPEPRPARTAKATPPQPQSAPKAKPAVNGQPAPDALEATLRRLGIATDTRLTVAHERARRASTDAVEARAHLESEIRAVLIARRADLDAAIKSLEVGRG